jgi:hypothetical protein
MIPSFRNPRRPRSRRARRPACRPRLEALEDRTLPSLAQAAAAPLAELGVAGYIPAQIRHAYGFDRIAFPGSAGTVAGDGSGQTIAIVVAAHDPNLAADLHAFDQQFNLADTTLTQVAQDGSRNFPAADVAWAAETALDVEWAHAIAPGARLLVVEASSTGQADLFAATDWAAQQPGVSVVSMSFGSPEDPGETALDAHFATPTGHAGVVFVAAAGDTAGVSYPAASPNVVSIGGTSLALDAANNRRAEVAWASGGGGLSQYEPIPDYQSGVLPPAVGSRGTPDVAYAADPTAGFAVYDSAGGGNPWTVMGGTSAGVPQWGALFAIADQGRALNDQGPLASRQALGMLYALPASAFYDVTAGGAGGNAAGPGYDLATGLGSPNADQVVAGLAAAAGSSPGTGMTPPSTTPPSTTPPTSNPPTSPPTSPGQGVPPPDTPPADPGLPPPPSLQTSHGTLTTLPQSVTTTAGSDFHGTVARVIDTFPGASAGTLTVVIDWGDGHTSDGTVTADGNDSYTVAGDHTYDDGGDFTITLTVTDSSSHLTEVAEDRAQVSAASTSSADVPPAPDPLPEPGVILFAMPVHTSRRSARQAAHHPAHHPARAHHRAHVVHVGLPPLL